MMPELCLVTTIVTMGFVAAALLRSYADAPMRSLPLEGQWVRYPGYKRPLYCLGWTEGGYIRLWTGKGIIVHVKPDQWSWSARILSSDEIDAELEASAPRVGL